MDPSKLLLATSTLAAVVVTAVSSVSPTGSPGPDAIVTFLLAWLVIWVGSSAPWWAVTAGGVIAVVGVGLSPWVVAGLLATCPTPARLRVVAVAGLVVALFHVGIDPFLGASALIAGVVMTFVVVAGLVHRTPPLRRRVIWSAAATTVCVVLAALGLGIAALQARAKLQQGNDLLQRGLDQLRAGDTSAAANTLRQAAADLDAATSSLDAIWAQPARLLPVVAQHRELATRTVSTASTSATAAADALSSVDIDQLRLVSGSIDAAALGALAEPLARLDVAVRQLATTLDSGNSPWLLGAVREQLDTGRAQIDDALHQTAASAAIAANGPAILGVDGPRRYLVVFTLPGAARALSGVVTDYAEISITDGTIAQTAFGRIDDLAGSDPTFWSSVTANPDMPSAARAMAAQYAAGGHAAVDGVIMMDASGIAALVGASGPITLPATLPEGITVPASVARLVSGQQVTADALRQFLLVDQYALPDEQRLALVEAAAGAALGQFLGAALPSVQQLADALGPAATEGHITWWASRPVEEEAFRLVGMAGRLPAPAGRDGLAIVTNNAGGNFIDGFLQRTVRYAATYDHASGHVVGDLTVTLHNGAPSSGLPAGIIGNALGLPTGTNRTELSIYTPLTATAATTTAATTATPTATAASTDGAWNVTTIQLDLLPGQTLTVTLHLDGTISAGAYSLLWRPQPLTSPDDLDIDVRGVGGGEIVAHVGPLTRTSVVGADSIDAER